MGYLRCLRTNLLGLIFLQAVSCGGGTDSTGPMTPVSDFVFKTASLREPVVGAAVTASGDETLIDVNGFYV